MNEKRKLNQTKHIKMKISDSSLNQEDILNLEDSQKIPNTPEQSKSKTSSQAGILQMRQASEEVKEKVTSA